VSCARLSSPSKCSKRSLPNSMLKNSPLSMKLTSSPSTPCWSYLARKSALLRTWGITKWFSVITVSRGECSIVASWIIWALCCSNLDPCWTGNAFCCSVVLWAGCCWHGDERRGIVLKEHGNISTVITLITFKGLIMSEIPMQNDTSPGVLSTVDYAMNWAFFHQKWPCCILKSLANLTIGDRWRSWSSPCQHATACPACHSLHHRHC